MYIYNKNKIVGTIKRLKLKGKTDNFGKIIPEGSLILNSFYAEDIEDLEIRAEITLSGIQFLNHQKILSLKDIKNQMNRGSLKFVFDKIDIDYS